MPDTIKMEYRVVVRKLSGGEMWGIYEYYPHINDISGNPVVVAGNSAGDLREAILRMHDATTKRALRWEDFNIAYRIDR